MSQNQNHILITDNSEEYFCKLKGLIQKKYVESRISYAKNCYDTLSIIKSEQIDIIIFDSISMFECEVDTLALCRQLIVNVKLIALFDKEYPSNLCRYYERGVKGFLTKQHSLSHINEAIESIKVNANFFESSLLLSLLKETECKPRLHSDLINGNKLSTEDLKIMQLIAQEFTNNQIAEQLLTSKKTIENKIHLLSNRLNVKSKVGIAALAGKIGLLN